MRKLLFALGFFLASAGWAFGQAEAPVPKRCSTHIRQFSNFHWLSSDMCPGDYDAFRSARRASGEWQKPFYRDGYYWGGETLIGAAVALDTLSTSQALSRGWVERNPFIGPRPSDRTLAISGALGFVAYSGLNAAAYHFSHNDPSRTWRVFGRVAVPLIVAGIHGGAAAHNFSLGTWHAPTVSQ